MKERFPQLADEIRRSQQAHRAVESDVTGVPGLWIECQIARHIDPPKKMAQAKRDVTASKLKPRPTPVVVTRQKGERQTKLFIRLGDLRKMIRTLEREFGASFLVMLDFDEFVTLFEAILLDKEVPL